MRRKKRELHQLHFTTKVLKFKRYSSLITDLTKVSEIFNVKTTTIAFSEIKMINNG